MRALRGTLRFGYRDQTWITKVAVLREAPSDNEERSVDPVRDPILKDWQIPPQGGILSLKRGGPGGNRTRSL